MLLSCEICNGKELFPSFFSGIDGQIMAFFVGFLASLIVGILISYWQFTSSIAGYRLKRITEATIEIISQENPGPA